MISPEKTRYTHAEWDAEAERRFGTDPKAWRFVCPSCGHVASIQDWLNAGAEVSSVAFSCVGRWLTTARNAFETGAPGPCNYAGGGLFRLNPITVVLPNGSEIQAFAFADEARAA